MAPSYLYAWKTAFNVEIASFPSLFDHNQYFFYILVLY
jgi:hypothetical protein